MKLKECWVAIIPAVVTFQATKKYVDVEPPILPLTIS